MSEQKTASEDYKLYEVVICTGSRVFRGTLRCELEQRLIDAFNEGVPVGASSRGVDFVPLSNVDCWDVQGNKAHYPGLYISKNSIILIAQLSGNDIEKRIAGYPYREKTGVPAEIFAAPYSIKGQVYLDTWGQLGDAIEEEISFLPLTGVEIEPPLPVGRSRFDFAAVNKRRIDFVAGT